MENVYSKTPFLILFFLLFTSNAFSQIQGSVKDSLSQPIPFANVQLFNLIDSTPVSGVAATEEGIYNINDFKPGTYIIVVSAVGYKSNSTAPFEIKSTNMHMHHDPIFLEGDNHQLQDVNVVAKKPMFEKKIDRMVVNVENSITSSGNTALEILEKSPGVIVDRQNNSISLAGKGGVEVIIDGKQTHMPIEAAVQMLDAMSADNVRRIELITTPPAKYDAEGNAGLINIVLKKHEDFGTNGTFFLGAGVSSREKMRGGLNINHHTKKVNFFGSYDVNFNNRRQHFEIYQGYYKDGTFSESYAKSERSALSLNQNIRMGLDYTITSKTSLSVLTSGYITNWDMDAVNKIRYWQDGTETKQSNMKINEINKWIHGMGNLNIRHYFKEEEILDFNINYLNYYDDNPSNYAVENFDNMGQQLPGEDIEVQKTTPIDIWVGALDYSNQISPNIKLEAGLKGTMSQFKNSVQVNYFESGIWISDPELTNVYWMDENIGAAYASLNYQLSDKTRFMAGLRYEYIDLVLDSETEKKIVDQHYGKFFPTFYFSQKLNSRNTVQLSYSKRINRPSFRQLAPFYLFHSPELIASGNENLLPAISNTAEISYQYKSYILTVSYTDTKNTISRFQPKYSADSTKLFYISKNLDKFQNFSSTLIFPVTVNDWWTMQNNFSWYWQRLVSDYENTHIDKKQNYFTFNTNQSFNLSKYFSAEISGQYMSKMLNGIYIQKPRGKVDIGIQWKLKNENSRFNLNITDIFRTNLWRNETNEPELNVNSHWSFDGETRVLRLTFTHNFGNEAIKVRKRNTGSEEEQKRVE